MIHRRMTCCRAGEALSRMPQSLSSYELCACQRRSCSAMLCLLWPLCLPSLHRDSPSSLERRLNGVPKSFSPPSVWLWVSASVPICCSDNGWARRHWSMGLIFKTLFLLSKYKAHGFFFIIMLVNFSHFSTLTLNVFMLLFFLNSFLPFSLLLFVPNSHNKLCLKQLILTISRTECSALWKFSYLNRLVLYFLNLASCKFPGHRQKVDGLLDTNGTWIALLSTVLNSCSVVKSTYHTSRGSTFSSHYPSQVTHRCLQFQPQGICQLLLYSSGTCVSTHMNRW